MTAPGMTPEYGSAQLQGLDPSPRSLRQGSKRVENLTPARGADLVNDFAPGGEGA